MPLAHFNQVLAHMSRVVNLIITIKLSHAMMPSNFGNSSSFRNHWRPVRLVLTKLKEVDRIVLEQ